MDRREYYIQWNTPNKEVLEFFEYLFRCGFTFRYYSEEGIFELESYGEDVYDNIEKWLRDTGKTITSAD